MTHEHDDIGLLERAYDLSGSDAEWFEDLATRVLSQSGYQRGGALIFDAPGVPEVPSQLVFVGVPPPIQDKALQATGMVSGYARALPNNEFELLFMGTDCWTLSTLQTPQDAQGRAALERVRAFWNPMELFGIVGRNPDGTCLVFSAILPEAARLTPSFKGHWTRMAVHLAAAWRLRRSLQQAPATRETQDGEAVIDPKSGRVAHAVGAAQPLDAREALQRAVCAIDRARIRTVRDDPLGAVELWSGLVAGRWSMIDRCDTDGRRYYVAHKNDPQAPEPRALSERERQVVAYAVQGHPNKLIAYELGISAATVSNHLRSAQQKLGLRSRTELVRVGRLLLGSATGKSTDSPSP